MLQETRLHRIRALLTRLNQVSTERIIRELGVSRETARRDIIELEALGLHAAFTAGWWRLKRGLNRR